VLLQCRIDVMCRLRMRCLRLESHRAVGSVSAIKSKVEGTTVMSVSIVPGGRWTHSDAVSKVLGLWLANTSWTWKNAASLW
jgi:hypothetical protein